MAEREDEEQLMLDLVEKYGTFDNHQRTTGAAEQHSEDRTEVVVCIPFPLPFSSFSCNEFVVPSYNPNDAQCQPVLLKAPRLESYYSTNHH